MSMTNTLKQAEKAILAVKKWQQMPFLKGFPRGAKAYTGKADGWTFITAGFSIEDQGFPPGSLGYDGTGTLSVAGTGPMMLRLPRDLAELAYKQALKLQSS